MMKQTEIGLLPDDWTTSTIGEELFIQQGKQVSKKNRIGDNQKPFLRTANVFWDGLDLSGLDKMNFTKAEEEKLQLLKDDLLVCEGGDIGRTTICETDLPNTYYQNHLFRLRPKNGSVYPRFFCYWMQYFVRHTEHYGSAGNKTTIPNLSKTRLEAFHFPLPGIHEQRNISQILSLIQSAIEKQDEIINATTELKNIAKQKLFNEGIVNEPTEEKKDVGIYPKSWRVIQLADAVSYIDYGFSAPIPKNPVKDGIKIVSTADITREGKLLYSKIRRIHAPSKTIERLTLTDGDVLFNWRNSSELIGKTTVFHEQSDPHIFASFILRIRCDEKNTHNYFLSYLLNYLREVGVFIQLSRRAVNQANYNKNEISVLPIPLPTYDEQIEITKALQVIDNKINFHQTKRETLIELFKTVLRKLMTGEVRVKDINFEKDYTIKEENLSMAAEA